MRPRLASVLLVAAALAIGGCSSSDDATGATTDDGGAPAPTQFGGSRPVTLRVPAGYDPSHPAPLVILLHGYSASGYVQDVIFHISSVADRYGYFFAAPDGTVDSKGFRFWNATDGCCDFDHSGVDDVAYLTGLVHDIEASYAIDAKRIYFVGHSNGGFMSHRLACDDASEIAAIVSVAGAVWSDASKCQPSAPVAVLEIHGDADQEVLYGGDPSAPYPSAMQTVETWAEKNGCGATPDTSAPPFDLGSSIPGDETTITRFGGCAAGGASELWTIAGGSHIPNWTPDFPDRVWQFFAAHPKP